MDSQVGGKVRLLALALGLAVLSELGIGVFVLVVVSVSLSRWFADPHRGMAASLLDRPVPRPYVPMPKDNWLGRFKTVATDPATWRDLVWPLVNSVVGLAIPVVVVSLLSSALFYLTLPVWWPLFSPLGTVDFVGFVPVSDEASSFLMLPFGLLILALWWWGVPRLLYVNAVGVQGRRHRFARGRAAPHRT
jgi:Putative sensor